jgi:hypothetical protein
VASGADFELMCYIVIFLLLLFIINIYFYKYNVILGRGIVASGADFELMCYIVIFKLLLFIINIYSNKYNVILGRGIVAYKSPLTRYQVQKILQKSLCLLGHDGMNFNTHSFRIGAATSASMSVPSDKLKEMGRWNSDAYKSYIRFPCRDISCDHLGNNTSM